MRLLLVCIALLCAACANSNRPRPVRIALVANSLTHLPVPLAEKLGFYRDEGVDVVIEPLQSTSKTAEALLAGSAELATAGYADVLTIAAQGRQLRSVVVNTVRDGRTIVASPARKDIRSMKDLKGKNFGVPGIGSGNHQFALHVFALHGLSRDAASFAGVGVGAPLITALDRGVVDAAILSSSDTTRFRHRHPGLTSLADASLSEGPGVIWPAGKAAFAVVFGRQDWIDANRDVVARIMRADCRALAWIQSHSAEELFDAIPAGYTSGDREDDLAVMRGERRLYSPDGLMPPGAPQTILEALGRTQEALRTAMIDLATTYTNEFVGAAK